MITESNTSCKNVWAIHAMSVPIPLMIAAGKLTRAIAAKTYAHHIVPTASLMTSAREVRPSLSALLKPQMEKVSSFHDLVTLQIGAYAVRTASKSADRKIADLFIYGVEFGFAAFDMT
jgi:hypothetical protein